MIDSRKPRIPVMRWGENEVPLPRHLISTRWKGRDPEPNPVKFKIVEDWTEEFSDEPLINLRHRFCPCAEANGSWSSDPDDWEVPMVAPKALPYLDEVKNGMKVLKKNGHGGDVARQHAITNLQFFADSHRAKQKWGEGEFYAGVPRGYKNVVQENMRFMKVLHVGNGKLRRKVNMRLVNKEL